MSIENLLNSSEFEYFNTSINKAIAQLEDEIMRVDPMLSVRTMTPHDINRELRKILIVLRDRTEDVVNELATLGDKQEMGQMVIERIRRTNDHSQYRKEDKLPPKKKTKKK